MSMANQIVQIRRAFKHLNPNDVRDAAERRIDIRLVAASSAGYAAMEDFLLPSSISTEKRYEAMLTLHRAGDPDSAAGQQYDLEIFEDGLARPRSAFTFPLQDPQRMVETILRRRDELGLPLARNFPEFRKVVVERVIRAVSKENALFSLVTALPDVLPTVLELPWALGEFASDTAFLTMNQLRMAFLLAAASDRPVGFATQKTEVAGIVAGAFGWRAIARELVGKIPLGGGLIPKTAIAYAGTYVVGKSMERFYRLGYGYTRDERRLVYAEAVNRGKRVAGSLLHELRGGDGPVSGDSCSD
ncbi:MAG: hypothetical protein IT160_16540 [Bryobacterales bacterium]|nr:hypothetical protein [Bryobacterales bacterium]